MRVEASPTIESKANGTTQDASIVRSTNAIEPIVCTSTWIFSGFWMLIVISHVILFFTNIFYAALYGFTILTDRNSSFGRRVQQSSIFEPVSQSIMTIVLILLAIVHVDLLVRISSASIRHRRLAFSFEPYRSNYQTVSKYKWWNFMRQKFKKIRTYFDVRGPHYDTLSDVREALELIFQTYQAYWMSVLVADPALNQFTVIVIVVNCWSTPLIRLWLPKEQIALQRLLVLLLDCSLDSFMSYGVKTYLLFSTLSDLKFDFKSGVLDYDILWDPTFFPKVWSRGELVFIGGVIDFMVVFFQAISIIKCLQAIERLVILKKNHPTAISDMSNRSQKNSFVLVKFPTSNFDPRKRMRKHYVLFILYGLALIIIHAYANSQQIKENPPVLSTCHLTMRPWFSSKSTCASIELNCYRLQIQGNKTELERLLEPYASQSLYLLMITHCPAVELPSRLSTLDWLTSLEVYNSTIKEWNKDASLKHSSQPRLKFLYFINIRGVSRLPDGLLNPSFPRKLENVYIVNTDLTTLPDDFDQIWNNSFLDFFFNGNEFSTGLPPAIVNIRSQVYSLADNQLTDVPAQLFMNRKYEALYISWNNISSLPEKIENFTAGIFDIRFTNITTSTAPSWLDDTFFQSSEVLLTGTSFCSNNTNASLPPFWPENQTGAAGKWKYSCRQPKQYSTFNMLEYTHNRPV